MKTKSELLALIPQLSKLMLDNAEFGHRQTFGDSEADCFEQWAENSICYEEDGWYIEISYRCMGEFYNGYRESGWGEVTQIYAIHEDEEAEETTDFSEEEINELWRALDKELETM